MNILKDTKKITQNLVPNLNSALNTIIHSLTDIFYVHGRGKANLHIVDNIASYRCSIPTILAAQVKYYGQYAEDLIIQSLLKATLPEKYETRKIKYLDIGANHPINMSNTWLLYCDGMTGTLVEPNPDMFEDLISIRPNDVLIQGAIGTQQDIDRASLFVSNRHELSSLNKEFIQEYNETRKFDDNIKEIDVRLFDINQIIEEHYQEHGIDFLNIDVESLDFEILETMNFDKYKPKVICIEPSDCFSHLDNHKNSDRINKFLQHYSYHLVAETSANMIFLHI